MADNMGLFGKSKEQKIREEAERQLLLEEAKRKIKAEGEARLAAKKLTSNKEQLRQKQIEDAKKWMREHPEAAKKRKRIILLIFCLLIGGCGLIVNNAPKNTANNNTEQEQQLNQITKLNNNISQLEADNIQDILNQCGLTGQVVEFKEVTNDDKRFPDCKLYKGGINQNHSGYNITVFTKADTVVYLLAFIDGGERELYADTKVVNVFDDFVLSSDEAVKYKILTEKLIKPVLRDPDSADFPGFSDWNMHKNPEHIIISSYVKSENDFGKKVETTFSITYSNGAPISIIINGKEYMK